MDHTATDLKAQATALRKSGHLYTEIAHILGVAKSTAYVWTHKTPVTLAKQNSIAAKFRLIQLANVGRLATLRIDRSKQIVDALQKQSDQIVLKTGFTSDHKKVIASIMYWCEGGKDVSHGMQFINSDPKMIRVFLSLLRESFTIDETKLKALIHLHEYHDSQKQLQFWSTVTGIPKSNFYKPFLKPNTGKNYHEGYQGCVSLRYSDSSLGKLIKMIYTGYSSNL